jgi:hypothetical protein
VIVCPCANPPSGSGRGCDNSAATGGAMLAASGVAYLSMDRLVFTTSGETPTATPPRSPMGSWRAFSRSGRRFPRTLRRLISTSPRLSRRALPMACECGALFRSLERWPGL